MKVTLFCFCGKQINAADFLRALDSNFDISTAAGPSQSVSSSGVNAYSDGAGALVDGIDTLGSLGTDQWGGIETATAFVDTQADSSFTTPSLPSPTTPTTPTDPKIEGYLHALWLQMKGERALAFLP